ncbi:hypothetical protein [Nocardioides panaciterrulae]|uniref:Uncharacterized protein n=1 Tax=Nocardioides panaciterrulae TaxID=661492 RepID=A0A7Y9E2T0_9ACTN|nr:hypothetical protein [Nocardioides panaciterrulae]NYD39972.1 hypothetical protein [Nocardioides panaciterrulae]
MAGALVSAALLLALAGCDDVPPPDADSSAPPARLSGTPAYDAGAEPAEAVLPLVPADATTLTVTDLDEVRRQLGVPDLTGADLRTDRSEFWARAATEAPLLTEGQLRPETSRLDLDYGFTEDDVDWEAHFRGPDGTGYVLALRPGLDLEPVRRAVRDGVAGLAGARVVAGEHLVVSGTTADSVASWATDPAVVGLVGDRAEATYVRRGCVPLTDALGPDADAEQQDRVAARVTQLDGLDAFAVSFGDHLATVRMATGRTDLFDRLHLGDHWPAGEFGEAFRNGVGDPATGRIGYQVPRPALAARLVLGEELPFAVCDEVTPIPEPTGP